MIKYFQKLWQNYKAKQQKRLLDYLWGIYNVREKDGVIYIMAEDKAIYALKEKDTIGKCIELLNTIRETEKEYALKQSNSHK